MRSAAASIRLSATELGTRDLAAVQCDEVELRAETARRDLRAFAVTAIDRYAGDALQRLSEVGVREFADVLSVDRVDDADRIALGLIEAFKLPRKPVTTTVSISSPCCSWANTGLTRTAPPTMVNSALEVIGNAFRLNFIIRCLLRTRTSI